MAEFRYFPLVVDGKAVAEINGFTVDFANAGERQIGAGVVLGVSDGVKTYDIKAQSVCPVGGHSVDLVALLQQGNDVAIGFDYNGGAYVAPYKVMKASIKHDAKTGAVTGDIELMNSGPAQKVA